ncbi:hypothetical protein Ga0061061_1177 [Chelatococcus sambhunathii]|uniref:Haemolysin XhlA n=1 Tax=Chelatococcus sambhunathii TaxID=363953 RepID=A0ABM9U9F5_9HYPH|nr:hypothetical protein [Chelatococcus sambhunathii]CUA90945.1 hypothetical protein Ga0061061_1177 [Chelatococcus sambhunathii]
MEENQLYLMLGRIDGKLDHVIQRADKQDNRADEIERVQSLHSERITTLERDRRWVIALAAALSTVMGWAISILKEYLFK